MIVHRNMDLLKFITFGSLRLGEVYRLAGGDDIRIKVSSTHTFNMESNVLTTASTTVRLVRFPKATLKVGYPETEGEATYELPFG